MKRFYYVFTSSWLLLILLAGSGCSTIKEPKHQPVIDFEERIMHTKKARKAWLRLLENAQTVDDAVKAREHLDQIQQNLEALEAGKKTKDDIDAGFKPTKERLVVWGPIGYLMWLATWLVDKLYIIYPWDWHVF